MFSKIFGFRQKTKPPTQSIQVMQLTIENLRRRNFAPEDFFESVTAEKTLHDKDPNNDIVNLPNYGQLTAGMKLADKMQELRDALNLPITISSGFRCEKLNKKVGGAPNSWHMQFLACDFNVKGLQPHEAVAAIKATKVSVDKVFVERGCVHMQTCMNDARNRNLFATAFKNENGDWVVVDGIRKV